MFLGDKVFLSPHYVEHIRIRIRIHIRIVEQCHTEHRRGFDLLNRL